jgi:anti-sigma B factor antagonist
METVDFGIDTTPTADGQGLVLAVHGELDLATCGEFTRPAQEAITGRRPLIVDLTACSFLDSSGLRAMLQVSAALEDGNEPAVPMAVVIGDSPAGRLLSLTELDKRLSVFATRQEAGEWLASRWKPNGTLGASSKTGTA